MSIGSKFRVPRGPFDLWPKQPSTPNGRVRVSQQFVEVINDGAANKVRLSQQFVEVINSGGANKTRVSQQFVEVIHAFGTPPVGGSPGKSGGSPGHNKPPQATTKWLMFHERETRHRSRRTGRFASGDVSVYSRDYVPPDFIPIKYIEVVKTVRIS
jgi:hypothetical protein